MIQAWNDDAGGGGQGGPVIINLEYYDNYVVDYETNLQVSKKPWLIMFVKKDCPACNVLKPRIEELAKLVSRQCNVGLIYQS